MAVDEASLEESNGGNEFSSSVDTLVKLGSLRDDDFWGVEVGSWQISQIEKMCPNYYVIYTYSIYNYIYIYVWV